MSKFVDWLEKHPKIAGAVCGAIGGVFSVKITPKDLSVKGLAGVLSLGCMSAEVVNVATNHSVKRDFAFCGGSLLFGGIYLFLDKQDQKKMAGQKALRNDGQDNTSPQPEPQSDTTPEPWTCHSFEELMDSRNNDSCAWIFPGYAAMGQISFLVASASIGKTTLMVQQAWCVATGNANPILPCGSPRAVRTKVLFYRLEEFAGEFELRYGPDGAKVLNAAGIMWKTLTDLKGRNLQSLLDDIKSYALQMTEDTLICIDPVTKLEDFKPKEFIAGFEECQRVAVSRGCTLSALISAHLEEMAEHRFVTTENIQGGDKLIQQAGAVFALRRARGKESARFIQTLKAPKGCADPGYVLVCEIVDEAPFLHMKYLGHKRLDEALPLKPKACVDDGSKEQAKGKRAENLVWTDEMVDLLKTMTDQPDISLAKIARALSELAGKNVYPEQVSRKQEELGLK